MAESGFTIEQIDEWQSPPRLKEPERSRNEPRLLSTRLNEGTQGRRYTTASVAPRSRSFPQAHADL